MSEAIRVRDQRRRFGRRTKKRKKKTRRGNKLQGATRGNQRVDWTLFFHHLPSLAVLRSESVKKQKREEPDWNAGCS
jgi:hypothetical protein